MKRCVDAIRRYFRYFCLAVILLVGTLAALSQAHVVRATAALAFSPPIGVQVDMYELNEVGGGLAPSLHRCGLGDTEYGCTARKGDENWGYPYASNSPVVAIESEYLLNVVSKEAIVSAYHPSAIEAIAAAARTYAYYHVGRTPRMNNSSSFQVFIPFAFENLRPEAPVHPNKPDRCTSTNLNDYQSTVCGAVARRIYISYPEGGDTAAPAFTEYFADIPTQTVTNIDHPDYLRSVSEPISQPPVVKNGHGHGMSQNGASRWAFGNLKFANSPYEADKWSTHFLSTEQILTHYYSGVTLRNAAAPSQTFGPGTRWAPLRITWFAGTSSTSPPLVHGRVYTVTVQVQNSSTLDWTCNYPFQRGIKLRYTWVRANGDTILGSTETSLCSVPGGVPRGADINAALRIQDIPNWGGGSYSIRLDVIAYLDASVGCSFTWPLTADNQPGALRFGEDCHWHTYDIKVDVCPDAGCIAHLPLIRKATNTGWPGQ